MVPVGPYLDDAPRHPGVQGVHATLHVRPVTARVTVLYKEDVQLSWVPPRDRKTYSFTKNTDKRFGYMSSTLFFRESIQYVEQGTDKYNFLKISTFSLSGKGVVICF